MKSIIITVLLSLYLHAAGPLLGMVQNIENNRFIEFSIGEFTYLTEPYGVLTLEELAKHSVMPSECRAHVENYYNRFPLKRDFASKYLKRGQLYHIEPREKGTLIHAKGMKTYSELLLSEGLAMRVPLFNDKEWGYRFKRVQKNARIQKKGLWAERIWLDCVTSLYRGE